MRACHSNETVVLRQFEVDPLLKWSRARPLGYPRAVFLNTTGAAAGGASVGLLLIAMGLAAYFAPTIVAYARNTSNKAGVLVLNLFLGWTFIGWVIALTMAAGGKVSGEVETVIVQNQAPAPPAVSGSPVLSPDGRFWWDGNAWKPLPDKSE